MNRVMHFEIQVEDIERAKTFYGTVFGWQFEDYSKYMEDAYWGIMTGNDDAPGINGGLLKRSKKLAASGANAFVATIVVADYDTYAEKIVKYGGKKVGKKMAIPGMAWQGYFYDTEKNLFGLHQADTTAK